MQNKQVVQSFFLVCLFQFLFLHQSAFAGAKKLEYFSYAIQCGNDDTKLLDFVESSLLRNQKITSKIMSAKSDQEIFSELSSYLKKLSPTRSKELIERYLQLKKSMVLSDSIKISAPDRPDNLLNLENCNISPIAASIINIDSKDIINNHILVDKNIWDKLKVFEQFAIILDFALAEEIRDENLIPSRIFMGYWFSNNFDPMNDKEWETFSEHLKLPFIEYRGIKIDMNPPYGNSYYVYKKSPLQFGNQILMVSGRMNLYPNGNFESFDNADPIDYEISPGKKVKLYAKRYSEDSYDNGSVQFFDDTKLIIKSGLVRSAVPIVLYGHEIDLDADKLNFAYLTPGILRNIDAKKAKILIRNKSYNVSSEVSYLNANIWFYENGAIAAASYFERGQSFIDKNLKSYTVSDVLVLTFTREGYLGPHDKIGK